MVRVTRVTALVWVTGSLVLAYSVSCGSSGEGPGTSSSVDGGVPLTNNEGGAGSPDGGAAQNNDQQCAPLDTQACETCCARHHQTGAGALTQALANCLCGPPVGKTGTCQSECANSDCSTSDAAAPPQSGDSCDTCERSNVLPDGGGGCGPAISSACGANSDCVALFQCWDLCAKQ